MRRTLRRTNERGLTLIELMVVMAILVILAAGITVSVLKWIPYSKMTRAKTDIATLEQAVSQYAVVASGQYPTTEQGLDALVQEPTSEPVPDNWDGPYVEKGRVPADPWGNDYQYRFPGEYNTDSFDLWTYGKDGEEGGEGEYADITNWQTEAT